MFKANENLINKDVAGRSHQFTSFSPEVRAKQEIDGFKDEVQGVYENLSSCVKSEAQKIYLIDAMEKFQELYAKKYNEYLGRKGRCFSVMITGGSNFNNRRHEKANNAEQNKYEEMKEFKTRAISGMRRALEQMAITEAGGEIAILQREIERMESAHAAMIARNKIIKSKKSTQEEKERAMREATGLSMQNVSAKIKRMKEHLEDLKKREATPTSDILFPGGSVVDNATAERIQIYFDQIPSEEIRANLKGSGWKFSPKSGAWQRMRTSASMASAKRICKVEV